MLKDVELYHKDLKNELFYVFFFKESFALLRKFKNIIAKAINTTTVTANKAMTAKLYPCVSGEVGSPKQTEQNTIYKAFIFLINCTQ